jgi:DNA-binding transcriptional LysR family regulator
VELRQLRHFAAVALHGTFSSAAKHLHLTQPALSRQVKRLEEELGVRLLRREANSVSLTPSGRAFYEETLDILQRLEKASNRIRQQPKTPLRVGYVQILVADLIPCVLSRFKGATEGMAPELFDLAPREVAAEALAGNLDVAILPRDVETAVPGFQWTRVRELPWVLVMPKKHPLAKLKRIPVKRLRNEPLHALGSEAFPDYAPRTRSMLGPLGIKPNFEIQTARTVSTLLAQLEADFGVAILCAGVNEMMPPNLTARPLFPAGVSLAVGVGLPLIERKPQAETFVSLLHEAGSSKNLKWR